MDTRKDAGTAEDWAARCGNRNKFELDRDEFFAAEHGANVSLKKHGTIREARLYWELKLEEEEHVSKRRTAASEYTKSKIAEEENAGAAD